jgi:hypothetical protein
MVTLKQQTQKVLKMVTLSKKQLKQLKELNKLVAKVAKAQQAVNTKLDGNEELVALVGDCGASQRLQQWENSQYHLRSFANYLNTI